MVEVTRELRKGTDTYELCIVSGRKLEYYVFSGSYWKIVCVNFRI